MIILFAIATLNLPAALGRCDIGHLLLNGLGFIIIILSILPYIKNKKFKIFLISLYIIFTINIWSNGILLFSNRSNDFIALINKPPSQIEEKITTRHYTEDGNLLDSLIMNSATKPLFLVTRPIRFFENDAYRKKLDFPFFVCMDFCHGDVTTFASAEILMKDVLMHNTIIIPKCIYYYTPLSKELGSYLFGIPILFYRQKNNPNIIYEKLHSILQKEYYIDTSIHNNKYFIYKKLE